MAGRLRGHGVGDGLSFVTDVLYLHGLWGNPEPSPALAALEAARDDLVIVAPTLPGFDGASGWEAPRDHLGWLALVWDQLDDLGVLPCPVVGASVGGMLAAELAIFRPEAVTALALLDPLGIWDPGLGGDDEFAVLGEARMQLTFSAEVPEAFRLQFSDRGPAEAYVARSIAAGRGGIAHVAVPGPRPRAPGPPHRLPDAGRVGRRRPRRAAALADRWPASNRLRVPGAGHMVEWDAPRRWPTPRPLPPPGLGVHHRLSLVEELLQPRVQLAGQLAHPRVAPGPYRACPAAAARRRSRAPCVDRRLRALRHRPLRTADPTGTMGTLAFSAR